MMVDCAGKVAKNLSQSLYLQLFCNHGNHFVVKTGIPFYGMYVYRIERKLKQLYQCAILARSRVQASSIEKVVQRVDTPEAISDLKTIIYLNLKVRVLRRQHQYPEYHQHKISTVRHHLSSLYLMFWHMYEPIFKISPNELYNK